MRGPDSDGRISVGAAALLAAMAAEAALAQLGWYERGARTSPQPRRHAGLACDTARGRAVLFGGLYADLWNRTLYGDTWQWDGSTWLQVTPPTSPPARYQHAMAYDSARGRIVLFGGHNDANPLGDTWEWDGTAWTEGTPPPRPPARSNHALAYDSARGRIILFGGSDGASNLDDTWEWDGTGWTQRFPAARPLARAGHAMAYDAVRNRTVLFGGAGIVTFADTWEYDGTTWVQRFVGGFPPARADHALAYDAGSRRVVLFGGGAYLSDTWEWDGTAWRQASHPSNPTGRIEHEMAYDCARGRMILFGGRSNGWNHLADLWEVYSRDPYCARLGTGHATGWLELFWRTPPVTGGSFRLTFSNEPPWPAGYNLLVVGYGLTQPLLLDAGVCSQGRLFVSPILPLEVLGNPAEFTIHIPADPNLVGVDLFGLQGASFEIASCFRLTDAIRVTIQ